MDRFDGGNITSGGILLGVNFDFAYLSRKNSSAFFLFCSPYLGTRFKLPRVVAPIYIIYYLL